MSSLPTLSNYFINPDHATAASFVLGTVALLSLRLLLIASDTPRLLRAKLQPRFAAILCDPSAPEDWIGDREKELEKGGGEQGSRDCVAEWVRRTQAPDEASLLRSGPGNLTTILDGTILVHSMGAFATLLAFLPGNMTGACEGRVRREGADELRRLRFPGGLVGTQWTAS